MNRIITIAFWGILALGIGWGVLSLGQRGDESVSLAANSPSELGAEVPAVDLQWRIFRGSQGLLGVAEGSLPDTLTLDWTFETEGPIMSSAAIVGDRVYIASTDNHVYCLDLETGERIWAFEADDPVESPPTVVQDRLFVGTLSGALYSLDATTGAQLWRYETDGQISGAANWFHDAQGALKVLVGSHDGSVHCVDAESGQRMWRFETDSYVNGTPAVNGTLCAFGGCDAALYVVDVADGMERARVDTGSYVAASAAFHEDRLYVGNYDGLFLCARVDEPNDWLWQYEIEGGAIFSSPAVGQGKVIFGDRDRQVHCLDEGDGHPIWVFKALDNVDSSPVICGDKVIFGSDDGRLYMVALENGEKLWSFDVGQPILSSPAVARGRVVVGCDDGTVYAFRAAQ